MAFAIKLDAFNFDESQGATEDPLLAGLLMMPLEAQILEVSTALLRHHISKATVSTNAVINMFEKAYPRTASSITNKKVLLTLLGLTGSPTYNDNVSVLQNLTESEPLASAVVCQYVRRTCEDQQLIAAIAQLLKVATQPSDAELGKALSLDPSNTRCFLEMIVENALAMGAMMGHDTNSGKKPFAFDHTNNSLEVNGFKLGTTSSSASFVRQLADLDLENAQLLGKGAGGQVIRARHIPTGEYMAVKTIFLEDNNMAQVESELSIVWGIAGPDGLLAERKESPFLIRSFGVFYSECTLYIVMEVMDGSLKDLIKPEGLPETTCRAVAFQTLSGIQYMHSHLKQLHRDIKPHNVLFRRKDGAVKLSDFGISSTRMETVQMNRKSTFCGTLRYLSPLVVEKSDYGFEADLWSLGVTLLELAHGKLPYSANTVFDIISLRNVPPRLACDGRFSAEFQSFISDLCDPSGQLPTAAQLLMHPWFRGYTLEASRKVIAVLAL